MAERWFSEEELEEMCRPTMDRAIEAIERGDLEEAKSLCEGMKHEWRWMHDLLVEGIAGSLSFIQERLGEDAVADSHRYGLEKGWRKSVQSIDALPRKQIVELLAQTWRAHSGSGTGPNPGAFSIEEDDEKFTFRMNPCGSGQRLWRNGRYEGPDAFALTRGPHEWTYGREDFPIYCTHCTFMNESLAIDWIGYPVYPSEPPEDFDVHPCTWYWYKDPADIPERYWQRYGREKPAEVRAGGEHQGG